MHVNGHKCHIAYLVPWNTKQLLTFRSEAAEQSPISILAHPLRVHVAADFLWREKEQARPMLFLPRSSHILPGAGRAGEWDVGAFLSSVICFIPGLSWEQQIPGQENEDGGLAAQMAASSSGLQ